MSRTIPEEAYLKTEIEKKTREYTKLKKIGEVEIYLQAQVAETFPEDIIRVYGNILEEELLPPFVKSINHFCLKPPPQYLVIAWGIPKDIVLFANAYNDGIKIYFNPRNVAFKWLWISDTTIFHEIGHIWESRKTHKPIRVRKGLNQSMEKFWSCMNSDLYVNSNLPDALSDRVSSLVCLSMLTPTQQDKLLESSATTLKMMWMDTTIPTLEFVRRFYTIPRKHPLIDQFLKACVDIKLPEAKLLEDIIINKNFDKFMLLAETSTSIILEITCLYSSVDSYHDMTITPSLKQQNKAR